MFLPSRFVVVDDKKHHLEGIKTALNELQFDCHSKLYDDETVGDWKPLVGTRILFLDQYLTSVGHVGTDKKAAFAALHEVIQKLICPDSGPYGLILWAETPEVEELKQNLFERFTGTDARYLPVFFASLTKGDYIDTNHGAVREANKLQEDILNRIEQSPQMKALFSWETDVSIAAGAVLRSMVNLVPLDKRSTEEFGTELGRVFYRLAQAGAGINRARDNPREAINKVLVPVLADRITEHDPQGDAADAWGTALVDPSQQETSVPVRAAVNTAVHISRTSSPNSIPIKATDLGSVVNYPFEEIEETLSSKFGLSRQIINDDKFFGLSDEDWEDCFLRLVQIGASCDYAQPKDGPLLYLLALEWAFKNEDGTRENGSRLHLKKTAKNGAQWMSPPIMVGTDPLAPGKISVFLNCSLSVTREEVKEWQPVCRMREELISELTQQFARHISRPGIISL